MPPPDAVKAGKVAPLTDEDRLTLVRWIDLGCPIDLDYDPKNPAKAGFGWMLDDQRPTLTLTSPQAGANPPLDRILIGMHDYGSGLERRELRGESPTSRSTASPRARTWRRSSSRRARASGNCR